MAARLIAPDWGLYEKDVGERGRGVFVGKRIPNNEVVLRFEGPVFTKETCPDFSEAIQVGINAWMWSSGGLDDLVNHSCNPNLGLWQTGGETYLLSLRDIAEGEELSFDYSTSMVDEPWSMQCCCGDAICRGTIANFLDMPDAVQQRYAERGVLPEHVWATAAARNVKLATPAPVVPGPATQAAQVAAPAVDAVSAETGISKSSVSTAARVHVPNWGLYEKEVGERGRGVFAGKHIPDNEIVLRFEGPIYTKETCPEFSEAIQVGINAWMWSSGGLDDLVNHSCNPNLGLWQTGGETYLLSLRDIAEGEELSFDYSTSMVDEPWSMQCCCGDAICRGTIANFLDMPDAVQQRYAERGVLPEHVWATAAARNVKLAKPSLSAAAVLAAKLSAEEPATPRSSRDGNTSPASEPERVAVATE